MPLRKNLILLFGILSAQFLHIAITYNPFMQRVLRVSPVNFKEWLALLGIASLILLSMEIFKVIRRRKDV